MTGPEVTDAPHADAACPTCSEPVFPGDQFCEACGNDLPADIAEATPPADAPQALDPESLTQATAPAGELGPTFHSCGGTFVDGWCDTCGDREPDPRDHQEVDLGKVAGVVSDKGLRHRHNEDGFELGAVDGAVVAVVCDGVSSTVNPDGASAAASLAAAARLRADPTDFVGAHADALAAVRNVEWTPKPGLGSPSCTFLAGTVVGDVVRVGGLGDCRAYWVPLDGDVVGEPQVLTTDHSWANEQVAAGHMTMVEAMADRRAHVITRWLGRDAKDEWRPEVNEFSASGPGLLVLCSDGLWNYLETPAALAEQVGKLGIDAAPVELARHLVSFALDAGGHDNVTVAVVPLGSAPAPAPAPEPSTDPTTDAQEPA